MNKARKVLVVNDDTKSEYIEILKSAGYQVEVANSEEKAKQNLESDNYDLIVSAPGAAERLDLQHELFHAIIDTIPVMIVIYDPHLNTFQFNKNFRDVLGWTEADAVDGDFMEKVYPDPEYRQMATEYMQSLEPGWRDFKTTAKDGSEVESSWANIKLSDDTIVGIGVDIRERKQAEEKLGSVALFPDENPNPVMRISDIGELLYINESGNEFLQNWCSAFERGIPDTLLSAVTDALSTGSTKEVEVACQGKTISFILAPITEQKYVNLYGHDVTK